MEITLKIPQKHYAFFEELMRTLSFPKIVEVKEGEDEEVALMSKEEFFAELKLSFEQAKLQEQGKLPEISAWQMIEKVERELANE